MASGKPGAVQTDGDSADGIVIRLLPSEGRIWAFPSLERDTAFSGYYPHETGRFTEASRNIQSRQVSLGETSGMTNNTAPPWI